MWGWGPDMNVHYFLYSSGQTSFKWLLQYPLTSSVRLLQLRLGDVIVSFTGCSFGFITPRCFCLVSVYSYVTWFWRWHCGNIFFGHTIACWPDIFIFIRLKFYSVCVFRYKGKRLGLLGKNQPRLESYFWEANSRLVTRIKFSASYGIEKFTRACRCSCLVRWLRTIVSSRLRRISVVGWGTMLQAGRSRARVPMKWIFFFNSSWVRLSV
jgi:hypothetical protein